MKELQLTRVNKRYKLDNKMEFQALFDVNVEFDKGELVSIVGESGSGKSTLMNLIGGLDSDFTGKIVAGGEDLSKLPEKDLDKYRKNKVGFVFQSFNLISHLSILDNVTLALTLSNIGEKEKIEKATQLLKRVGLDGHLKKKPTQLSGGQKQRVAIARALINDPEIIIADEPTGALDSETSMQILQILKEIADSGKLVIMVTHSEKVAAVSSRVVKISDGRITSDTINPDYQKTPQIEQPKEAVEEKKEEVALSQAEPSSKKKAKKKKSKDIQNLSLMSAIRLSLHNMWASKVKNFLMAFGVAIGIGSLILMLCFSSGITDFITDTMKSYSDPTIVTITKKGEDDSMMGMLNYNNTSFKTDEIEKLKNDINSHLEKKGVDYRISNDNLSQGVQLMTMVTSANIIYNPTNKDIDYFLKNEADQYYFNQDGLKEADIAFEQIMCIYTIPPYYSPSNVVEGKLSTKDGGIMLTKGGLEVFEDKSIFDANGKNRKVDIAFNLNGTQVFYSQEVTGVMDTSIMSGITVMYVDYEYFQQLYAGKSGNDPLDPNTLYVKTDSEETTKIINEYLASTGKYNGSIEDQLAGMFSSMTNVIGTSLVVISSISLLVSAMMILVVLYMSVTERTKEIGVLKSIGARRKDIKRIFTSESFLVGVLSGVMGILFSLFFALVIWIVLKSTIGLAPISFRWWYFVVAMLVSVCISMLSGLYPASKAAKLDPVESLRRE